MPGRGVRSVNKKTPRLDKPDGALCAFNGEISLNLSTLYIDSFHFFDNAFRCYAKGFIQVAYHLPLGSKRIDLAPADAQAVRGFIGMQKSLSRQHLGWSNGELPVFS